MEANINFKIINHPKNKSQKKLENNKRWMKCKHNILKPMWCSESGVKKVFIVVNTNIKKQERL